MKLGRPVAGSVALLMVCLAGSRAADLPKAINSAACAKPPVIDGSIAAGEWDNAPTIRFDLRLVQLKPPGNSVTQAELRIMNSANALYIALRVRDESVNSSLSPLDIDLAMLAFCRGQELARGDDRKVIAAGFYVDKHVTEPGKDADDKKQDGRGSVAHAEGWYTFEWAVPLDSGDDEDLRARPGDTIRFNIAYLDAFGTDKARAGGIFVADLDHAINWGTLQLAKDVKHDGGGAFRGLAWVNALLKNLPLPANRMQVVDSASVPGQTPAIAKVVATYRYRDHHGKDQTGKAKLFLPYALQQNPGSRVPLFHNAGYELDDAAAAGLAKRGWVVASQREVDPNPLIRTVNPDLALLHIARALPFIDDARVMISGGSAGGYMTLMLAAETFPLAGAAPDVPPVNWGYNAAYFFTQRPMFGPEKPGEAARIPVLFAIAPVLESAIKVYGGSFGDATWFRHSPVAHVPTITCPVSATWSTADVLVPINQVGPKWIRPFDATQFPAGFTMDPAKLLESTEGRTRLTDVLPQDRYEVFVIAAPPGSKRPPVPAGTAPSKPIELPVSRSRQWSISILDEGAPDPLVGHLKYQISQSREEFYKRTLTAPLDADQLTMTKLERLMDRYTGIEWLPTALKHLDFIETERADVIRGIKTYVAVSDAHARKFIDVYERLPAPKQVLPADLLTAIRRR